MAQLVGELDDQDAVFADQADQCHQADLGIDVQARHAEEQRYQRTADRQRHGDHDHQRIAEAFELCGEDQEDDRQGQSEGDQQCAAFLHVLPGSAGVVDGEATRGFLAGDLLNRLDGLAHADDGEAGDDRRVELLELVQLPWPCPFVGLDQGREGDQWAVAALHVVAAEPAGIVAIGAFDLGDDLVAAPVDGEAVDLALAEQAGQRHPQVLHGDAHLRGLLAVDVDHQLGFVERQVEIEEGELAGLAGALLHPLRHLQQRLVVVGGVEHELEWQALAGAR